MSVEKYSRKCVNCESRDYGKKEKNVMICVVCGKPKYSSKRIDKDTDAEIKTSHLKGSWHDCPDEGIIAYDPDLFKTKELPPEVDPASGARYDRGSE